MRVRERHKREDDAERGASRVVPGRLICQPMKLNKRGPTPMKIIKLAAGIVAAALILGGVSAQAQANDKIEKPDLVLGVGGKSSLYYLPLTLAERLGYFREQGLNVSITDFGGGSKSLQSLIGGSADVVTGAYEHTIRMQSKGQDIAAVIELGRFPGMV